MPGLPVGAWDAFVYTGGVFVDEFPPPLDDPVLF